MNIPEFKSPKIRANIDEFAKLATERLAGLDEFNDEIKKLERLFKSVCVSDTFAVLEHDPHLGLFGIAWLQSTGRIYLADDFQPKIGVSNKDEALTDACAQLRHHAKDQDWLGELLVQVNKDLRRIEPSKEYAKLVVADA